MLRKSGIVRKTFLFSSFLIVLVIILSFSVLYFVMPGYYFGQKERMLRDNLNELTTELKAAETQEECISLISGFVRKNNADVMAYDAEDLLLIEMSSPFVSMQGDESGNGFYLTTSTKIFDSDAISGNIIITMRQTGQEGEDNSGEKIGLFGSAKETQNQTNVMQTKIRTVSPIKQQSVISMRSDVGTEFVGHVEAAGTLQPIDEAKGVILSLIPYVLLGAVAVGLLMSWLYARQISKPILEISGAAVKMRDMQPDAASGVNTNDELGQLAQNLNDLYSKLRENINHLEDEMERVNRLERSKTEMMQSASHELKTPVAALSGMLDGMIDNVGAYKDRDKYLIECRGQVEKLSWLVKEILDASKGDYPAQDIQAEETDVDILLEQVFEEFEPMTKEKELCVEKDISPVSIETDSAMLYRVLANLVANAVRYTPEKGEIYVVLTGGLLSIENKCEPIPDEELEKLFEPFYTRSMSRDRAHSGTGLGLYIVKRNLERLKIPYKLENTGTGIKMTIIL